MNNDKENIYKNIYVSGLSVFQTILLFIMLDLLSVLISYYIAKFIFYNNGDIIGGNLAVALYREGLVVMMEIAHLPYLGLFTAIMLLITKPITNRNLKKNIIYKYVIYCYCVTLFFSRIIFWSAILLLHTILGIPFAQLEIPLLLAYFVYLSPPIVGGAAWAVLTRASSK